jgi:hypothetical protein
MYSDKVKFEFEYIDPCLCNAWVATAVIGTGLLSAGATIYSADKASQAQTDAANTAAAAATHAFDTTNTNLAPYRQIGNTAADSLTSKLSDLTTPITMDQSTLEKTPGYQFNLTQGLKAAQNSAASRGLGTSGAALKGATTFATGLADNTYQNQFSNANTNQSNAYARLSGLVNTGENAAAGTGTAATTAAGQIGQAATNAGNAQAAAYNQSGSAISNLSNNVSGYAAYKGLYGPSINANGSISGAVGPTSVNGAPLVF